MSDNLHDVALSFAEVDYSIGRKKILDRVSFKVPKGTVFAIVGHNGAGKTTLFHLLLGLKFQQSGQILLSSKSNLDYRARAGLGYVPERPYVELDITFRQHLMFHARLSGVSINEFALEVVRVANWVGLEKSLDSELSTFSKGMLQKALLAQAMLCDPNLLILDEPMSGLDPDARNELKLKITELKRAKKTLIFSSHALEDVEQLADWVLSLHEGKVNFSGTVQEWRLSR